MRYLKMAALFAVLNLGAWIMPQKVSAQQGSVSYQSFYDDLSPYGMWVDYPNYGYVWIPNAGPGFSPYETAGHWVFTDDGWTWVSDYPWGWAPFHYGRWDYDNGYGWFWVPDNEWGPAWVSWRSSPGYYGWAPMRPGISVTIAFGRDYHEQNERWIFVRDRDISRSDIGRHYIDRNRNNTIINNSTVIVNTRNDKERNVTYIAGPGRDDVQRVTHKPVTSVAIRGTDKPGQHVSNGELQIYRPQIQKKSGDGRVPAPSKVMKLNEIKPVVERNAGNRPGAVSPVNKSVQNQPSKQRAVQPSVVRAKEPQKIVPPKNIQASQQRTIQPPAIRAKQPQKIVPPKNVQASQQRTNQPPVIRAKQPQKIVSPKNIQPSKPRDVQPSAARSKPPQKAAQPRMVQPSQPRPQQEEKERGK